MDPKRLQAFVVNFDEAVRACADRLGVQFANYPNGSCGAASEILAECLYQHDFGVFSYISGKDGEQSHAWLEKDGVIIDVTAGQFEDAPEDIIVSQNSSWHERFVDRVVMPNGSFRSWGIEPPDSAIAYSEISKLLTR